MDITTPFEIAGKKLRNRLIAGPMAGVSTAPYRKLIEQYSQPAICYTEMISANHLSRGQQSRKRYLYRAPEEISVCYQISGDSSQHIALATKMVHDAGADFIDLNCGCPKPKIRKKGFGSAILAKPNQLAQCIRAMKENTTQPIGIKIRVDGNSQDQFNPIIADIIQNEGCDFVTIHGRHWTDTYENPCHYDQISYFTNKLNIPVIGNGDVKDYPTLKKMQNTHINAIMISRATMGRPWLIAQLLAQANDTEYPTPNIKTVGNTFLEHIKGLADLDGEHSAVLQARKFAKYYARDIINRKLFCEQICHTNTVSELHQLIEQFFLNENT